MNERDSRVFNDRELRKTFQIDKSIGLKISAVRDEILIKRTPSRGGRTIEVAIFPYLNYTMLLRIIKKCVLIDPNTLSVYMKNSLYKNGYPKTNSDLKA